MSITVISDAVTATGLLDSGTVARPLDGKPIPTRTLEVMLEGAGEHGTGLWECAPGRFERQLENAEVMHILSGACTFTPTGQTPVQIRAGDTLFFPRHTTGVWEISDTLRKVYVVLALD